MKSGIHMRGSENHEPPVRLPVSAPPFVHTMEPPEVLWAALELARLTYPTLGMADQTGPAAWLIMEHTHVKSDDGRFVLRLDPNEQHGPSVYEAVSGRYSIAKHQKKYGGPRTHQLQTLGNEKRQGECGERISHLFMIDLRKAVLRLDLGRRKQNPDGGRFVEFHPLDPGVSAFCERLRTS